MGVYMEEAWENVLSQQLPLINFKRAIVIFFAQVKRFYPKEKFKLRGK